MHLKLAIVIHTNTAHNHGTTMHPVFQEAFSLCAVPLRSSIRYKYSLRLHLISLLDVEEQRLPNTSVDV